MRETPLEFLLPLVVLQQGTQLIAVPNGKNVRNWKIRNQLLGSETVWLWVI